MQEQVPVEQALERRFPEAVVLVTTRGRDGSPNAMTAAWYAQASFEPPLIVLGIDPGAFTFQLIQETREFVVAFPSEGQARETLFVGETHGAPGRDKLAEAGLAAERAAAVKAPLIADAVANFECELVEVTQPGDCALVVGKIAAAHVNSDPSIRRLFIIGKGHALGRVRVEM